MRFAATGRGFYIAPIQFVKTLTFYFHVHFNHHGNSTYLRLTSAASTANSPCANRPARQFSKSPCSGSRGDALTYRYSGCQALVPLWSDFKYSHEISRP